MFVLRKTGLPAACAAARGPAGGAAGSGPGSPGGKGGPDPDPPPRPPAPGPARLEGTPGGASAPPRLFGNTVQKKGGQPARAPTAPAEERATEEPGALPAARLGPAGARGLAPCRCGSAVGGGPREKPAPSSTASSPTTTTTTSPRDGPTGKEPFLRKCGSEAGSQVCAPGHCISTPGHTAPRSPRLVPAPRSWHTAPAGPRGRGHIRVTPPASFLTQESRLRANKGHPNYVPFPDSFILAVLIIHKHKVKRPSLLLFFFF